MNLIRIRIIFTVILILLISLCFLTYRTLDSYMKAVEKIRHSNLVINATQQILSSIKDAETGHRGYHLTNDESYLNPYNEALIEIPKRFRVLDSLSRNDQPLRKKVDTLALLINDQFRIIARILRSGNRNNQLLKPEELRLLAEGKITMDSIRRTSNGIISSEQRKRSNAMAVEGGFKDFAPATFLGTALIACGAVFLLFTRAVLVIQQRDKQSKELSTALQNLQKEIQVRMFTQTLLRNVWDNSLDVIQVFGSIRDNAGQIKDFKFIIANKAATRLVNLNEEDLLNRTLLEVYPSYEGDLIEAYKEVVETGITYKRELQFEVDQEQRWFKLVAVRFEDGFVVTFSDITEEKLNVLRMQKFAQELKRSNEDLEQFAFVASHDLQEPLRKIRSFGDRLHAKYSSVIDATGHDYISRMQSASSRMQVLIEDLLSFSRVTRSHELPEKIDMKMILEEVIDDLSDQVKRESAAITFYELPEVIGIRGQIKRLFQNVLSNGMKFRKTEATPIISITGKIISADEASREFAINGEFERYARFEVTDNGIGFDDKYAEQIFNVFQRLHGRMEFEGTGIGLAICRKIANNNKGGIRAKSEKGVGSRFIVILPAEIN
jgi:signal transduction histidine kinase